MVADQNIAFQKNLEVLIFEDGDKFRGSNERKSG